MDFITDFGAKVRKWKVWDLFSLYLSFSHFSTEVSYKVHSLNQSFFIQTTLLGSAPTLNMSKIYFIWLNFYQFISNLFYNQSSLYLFTHKSLQFESNAFNLSFFNDNYNFFRYTNLFFQNKESTFSEKSSAIFKKFALRSRSISFILDTRAFYKTIFFLKKWNSYVIGLIPYSTSPWLVNYPILVSTLNPLTQYFFLKILTYAKQESKTLYFKNMLNFWPPIRLM
jgi:hypothetical protein